MLPRRAGCLLHRPPFRLTPFRRAVPRARLAGAASRPHPCACAAPRPPRLAASAFGSGRSFRAGGMTTALDLFPETRPQGPPGDCHPGTPFAFEPDLVIELRGRAVPYRLEHRPVRAGVRRIINAFVPQHVRQYQAELKLAAHEAMAGRDMLAGPLEVAVTVFLQPLASFSRKRLDLALRGWIRPVARPDLDNYCKGTADACTGVVWRDDAEIATLHLEKWFDVDPRIRIEVRRLPTCP